MTKLVNLTNDQVQTCAYNATGQQATADASGYGLQLCLQMNRIIKDNFKID